MFAVYEVRGFRPVSKNNMVLSGMCEFVSRRFLLEVDKPPSDDASGTKCRVLEVVLETSEGWKEVSAIYKGTHTKMSEVLASRDAGLNILIDEYNDR